MFPYRKSYLLKNIHKHYITQPLHFTSKTQQHDNKDEVILLYKVVWHLFIIVLSSLCISCAFNWFLIPHHLLSGGVSGIGMLLGYFANLNLSITYFLLNIPLLVTGWFVLGRRFIMLTVVSVMTTSWLISVIPPSPLVTDHFLSCVFGGVLVGIGAGISFRVGGSTGGLDILGSIFTKYLEFPIGTIMAGMNGLIIWASGYFSGNWNSALASMVSIYISGKVVDTIHVRHVKITLFIITNETERLLEKLLAHRRGVTTIRTKGAFSGVEKDMLMTVTTKYELIELEQIIKHTDPKAFVNIVETVGVMGSFQKNELT